MFDPKKLEELGARLAAMFAASPAADIEKNMRACLTHFFAKLDLVSREEFEIQAELLRRSQEKLSELDEKVRTLEKQSKSETLH